MTFSIASDYTVFDFGQTVSLRQIRPEGVTVVSVSNAIDGPLTSVRNTFSGLEVTGDERVWSLNATQPGSRGVALKDIITDAAGNTWRVLSASLMSADARWLCLCRKQV